MKEPAKEKVKELAGRFRYNLDVYKKSTYNETQVRQEFIDPFFEALGNKQGHAEQYKGVVHEDAIKVGRSTRAPIIVSESGVCMECKAAIAPRWILRKYRSTTAGLLPRRTNNLI